MVGKQRARCQDDKSSGSDLYLELVRDQETIEETVEVVVLPKIQDRAAPPGTTGEDTTLIHQPAGEDEEIHIKLAMASSLSWLCGGFKIQIMRLCISLIR